MAHVRGADAGTYRSTVESERSETKRRSGCFLEPRVWVRESKEAEPAVFEGLAGGARREELACRDLAACGAPAKHGLARG